MPANARFIIDKRFWICGLVMTIAAQFVGFVVHGWLLDPDYRALAALYRPRDEAGSYLGWMVLAHACIGFALTWLYAQGDRRGGSTLGQGLRFGFALALFSVIPGYLIYYAVQPLPAELVAKQIVFGTVGMLVLGVLVAWLQPHRPVLADPG
ncbi:MAG: hypothetical protein ACR2J7_04575 [Luteimonas sp.]